MAAPQRRIRTGPQRTIRRLEETPGRVRGPAQRQVRDGAQRGRVFVVLVVVPVLLMLGSVYLQTVASGFAGEAARIEDEKIRAEGEGERLEVRLTELLEPGSIRSSAREDLQMRDPGAEDFEIYGRHGEDVVDGGGEKEKGTDQ